MRKRIISLALAVVMICTMLPQIYTGTVASSAQWDVINVKKITGNDIVAQARTYLGVPYDTSDGNYKYRTGFGSTMMFDCSGFVYRVCRDVGLASSRKNYSMGQNDTNGQPLEGKDAYGNYYITAHTQEQRYYGQDISDAVKKYLDTGDYSELCAGDLLFISNNNSNVTHVAIYTGDGKIIHSEGYHGCVAEHPISRYHSSNNKKNWYFAGCRLVEQSYVGQCNSYPTYCSIKISSSTTYVKSLPCSKATDPNSLDVEKASKDDSYQAIGLVENTAGNLWYKVTAKNGSVGYIYAGDTTYVALSIHDIKGTGITAPTNHIAGASYVLTGTVSSTYNQLTAVSAYVYAGTSEQGTIETGDTASVSGNYFSLGGSSIDKQTKFGMLPVGTHTYVVWASYKSYYAKSATSLGTKTGEIGIYKETFRVIDGPATCSHSYICETTKESTCLVDGVWTYTCSKCGASYTEPIPATGYHSWGAWGVKQEATCTTSGVKSRKCYVCWEDEIQETPRIDHSYGDWTVTTTADCVTDGIKMRLCQYCGHKQTETETAPGHDYDQWTIGLQPSCEMNGEEYRVCQRCADVQTREIQALGHEYVSFTEEPTCEDDGYTYRSCTHCGVIFENEIFPALGHDYQDGICSHCNKWEMEIFPENLAGDLTGDLEITSADTVLLARYLVGEAELNDQQLQAADVNGDGEVTSADTVRLARYLAGLVDSL